MKVFTTYETIEAIYTNNHGFITRKEIDDNRKSCFRNHGAYNK